MNVSVPKESVLRLIQISLETKLSKLGGFGYAQALPEDKGVLDDTTKILIYNKENKEVAFLLCSFSKFSNIPTINSDKSQSIKSRLGIALGSVILTPLLFGEEEGIEYAVWPYCHPLKKGRIRRKIQLFYLKPIILNWLKNANEESLCKVSHEEIEEDFVSPLQRLKLRNNIAEKVKDEINWQIEAIEGSDWVPFYVMAHNDLWLDNFLIDKKEANNDFKGLTVIDWAGSIYKGIAIYDLVRISMSMNVSRKSFSKELSAHCEILGCNKRNSLGYLLVSFAFLAENLGQFPEERFNLLLNKCFKYLHERV